jgi:hypothetical protein
LVSPACLKAKNPSLAELSYLLGSLDWNELIPLIGRAIAGYEGVLYGVPNPGFLLSPLTAQEAVLSSRIEGTQAELEDVCKFEAGEIAPDKERRAEQLLTTKPLCLDTLLKLRSILPDSIRGHNKQPGQFRTIQNWIGPEGTPKSATNTSSGCANSDNPAVDLYGRCSSSPLLTCRLRQMPLKPKPSKTSTSGSSDRFSISLIPNTSSRCSTGFSSTRYFAAAIWRRAMTCQTPRW